MENKPKFIVIMGAPGAGKGTQAKQIVKEFQIPHISTGDMFREAVAAQTETGKLAESYMKRGDLVPDSVTIKIVEERLSKPDCENGFLLDGFPRTIPQAEALEELTNKIGRSINLVINIDVPNEELIRRICGRRVCKKCGAPYHIETMKPKVEGVCDVCGGPLFQRPDDNEDALKVRLDHYVKDTKPLLNFYSAKGLVSTIDGTTGLDNVFNDIKNLILQN